MSIIENFAALSFQEQKDFAEALVKTINSESTFTDQTNFKVIEVEANEMTGGLIIELDPEDTIEVAREATWACGYKEDADNTPEDPEFEDLLYNDVKGAFKTHATEFEGYSITLSVDDVDEEGIVEVKVDSVRDEDAGIGWYEYWGHEEYDSRPYYAVEGTLVQACTVYCSLEVEAAAHFEAEVEED